MKPENLAAFLLANGWEKDRFGHFKKQMTVKLTRVNPGQEVTKLYRVKLQATSARYEVQTEANGENMWVRLTSAYFKDITLHEKGVKLGSVLIIGDALAVANG